MNLKFICKPFSELSTIQLYELLKLRIQVFIVEQNCPYPEADDKDQESQHLLHYDTEGRLIAYARIVPPGLSYPNYSSIGRVVTALEARGTGTGKALMIEAIEACFKSHPNKSIKISAQVYALPFYEKLGFQSIGEGYLEDDIPHQGMILAPS